MATALAERPYSQPKFEAAHELICEWEKIKTYSKEVFSSAVGVGSFLLGGAYAVVNGAIVTKVIGAYGLKSISDPFRTMNLGCKLLAGPFICIMGPIMEEVVFREQLPEKMKTPLFECYKTLGFNESSAKTCARITSVFLSAILFGLVHFTNAIFFCCSPYLFLPQVIAATIAGFTFGLANELSGDLVVPCGMHIGNNTLAWLNMVFQ